MRTIDADALIEKYGDWYVEEGTESGFIGTLKNLLAAMPTIQPQSTTGQLNDGVRSTARSTDLIDRQAALDIFDDYNVSVENGELEAYSRDRKRMCELPPAQPEPTDINAKEAVYNLAEKIGIHQLFALTVELRGEPIQPEPAIPVTWIEKYIEQLNCTPGIFAELRASIIEAMLSWWKKGE